MHKRKRNAVFPLASQQMALRERELRAAIALQRDRSLLRLVIPTRRADSDVDVDFESGGSGNDSSDNQPASVAAKGATVGVSSTGSASASAFGTLTPDAPGRPEISLNPLSQHVECVDGEYIVFHDPVTPNAGTLRAFDVHNRTLSTCRVFPLNQHSQLLDLFTIALPTRRLLVPRRIKTRDAHAKVYTFFDVNHGDLHGYIRERQRLTECESRRLFLQVVEALLEAHQCGLVLQDLKLRKLVFADAQQNELKLDGLTECVRLTDPLDDKLGGPHQCCPAYLSPEKLDNARTGLTYSGRTSDCWALGVVLYTMLTGRYPFWSSEPIALFQRIAAAQFCLPLHYSAAARSLVAGLLRRDPNERLTVAQVLRHPWLTTTACLDHPDAQCPNSRLSMSSSKRFSPSASRFTPNAVSAATHHELRGNAVDLAAAIYSPSSEPPAGSDANPRASYRYQYDSLAHAQASTAQSASASAAAVTIITPSSLNRSSRDETTAATTTNQMRAINSTESDSRAFANTSSQNTRSSSSTGRALSSNQLGSGGRSGPLQHGDSASASYYSDSDSDADSNVGSASESDAMEGRRSDRSTLRAGSSAGVSAIRNSRRHLRRALRTSPYSQSLTHMYANTHASAHNSLHTRAFSLVRSDRNRNRNGLQSCNESERFVPLP